MSKKTIAKGPEESNEPDPRIIEFFTQAHFDQLVKNGQSPGEDRVPVVALHFPRSEVVWLLTEIQGQGRHQEAFGLCDLNLGYPHLAKVPLAWILRIGEPRWYRPELFTDVSLEYPLSSYLQAARDFGYVVFDSFYMPDIKDGLPTCDTCGLSKNLEYDWFGNAICNTCHKEI